MNTPEISIIAAMSENRVIGKDNKIPWHIKDDLVRLKTLTSGRTVILGRKTFDSMRFYYQKSGRPMPGKLYIMITQNSEYQTQQDTAITASSLENALDIARQKEIDEIFIIGGQRVFEQAIPLADRLYLTIVKGDFTGDAFFPDYSAFSKVISKEEKESGEYQYTFFTLEKP